MRKKMTKEMVENLMHILLGGGSRYDFERIHNFDKKKLDHWLERLYRKISTLK